VIYITILSRSNNGFEGPNLDADEINYCMLIKATGRQKDKNTILWDVTLCSLIKSLLMF
jgi:hypothetical protein